MKNKSLLALGVWNIGESLFHNKLMPKESKSLIKASYKKGYRCFDTAFSYKEADSLLYSALKEIGAKREEYKLWSKVMAVPTIKKKAETSLLRLKTDYLDILMLHWPSEDKSLFSSLVELEKIVKEGKAKEMGVSNFPLSLLTKCAKDFSILYHERPLSLAWAKNWREEKKENIKTIAYGPSAFGLLSGHYSPSFLPKDKRRDLELLSSPFFSRLLEYLKKLGEKYKVSPYSIALSWVAKEEPWAILRGCGKIEDLDIEVIEFEKEEIETLDNLSLSINPYLSSDNIFSHSWQ